MRCNHDDEYKRPMGLRISNFLAPMIAMAVVIFALPDGTNFLLMVICAVAVYFLTERLHFHFLDKPAIHEWLREHMEKYHSDELRKVVDD